MTPDELWRAVGEELLVQRTRKGWNPIDVERAGGPTYATVQAIERGEAGRVDSLAKHAEALGLSVVDVLRSVLLPKNMRLTSDELMIVRKFQTTTSRGRTALLNLAEALPDAEPDPGPTGSSG